MHPTATHNEFLRLRVNGLSLARISRQLGVSKPTLIAWSRQSRPEIASRILEAQQGVQQEITASADQQLAGLNRKLTALRQELFSRALRDIATPNLEILAGELRQRIQQLEAAKTGSAPPSVVSPNADQLGPLAPEPHHAGDSEESEAVRT